MKYLVCKWSLHYMFNYVCLLTLLKIKPVVPVSGFDPQLWPAVLITPVSHCLTETDGTGKQKLTSQCGRFIIKNIIQWNVMEDVYLYGLLNDDRRGLSTQSVQFFPKSRVFCCKHSLDLSQLVLSICTNTAHLHYNQALIYDLLARTLKSGTN